MSSVIDNKIVRIVVAIRRCNYTIHHFNKVWEIAALRTRNIYTIQEGSPIQIITQEAQGTQTFCWG